MAGFSRIYCIGGTGGFAGSDGINPIELQIWVGDASRQWVQAHAVDGSIRPMGKIEVIVPQGPDHANLLIDACLAFYPRHFAKCPLLAEVEAAAGEMTRLDFDLRPHDIPAQWNDLRKQAMPLFKSLNIFQADLVRLDLGATE